MTSFELHDQTNYMVAPSFLAADFLQVGNEVDWLNKSEADLIHLDVMDGQFVPNISFGLPVIESIHRQSQKPLDVHLMIHHPAHFIESFRQVGADIITVHLEACVHLHRVIGQIKESGAHAGVALNPHTSVNMLDDVLDQVDMVCLMSVNPGFGGQIFIERTFEKIKQLKRKISERRLSTKIQVDGGVSLQNAKTLLSAGADILVAGSAIFRATDRDVALQRFKEL